MTPDSTDLAWPPRLAHGTELLGQLKDSGYAEPPSLVRRADGQVIQLPRLMYLVASLMDGTRGPDVIAALATAIGAAITVVSGPELKSKWVGESEENLRGVFMRARQN